MIGADAVAVGIGARPGRDADAIVRAIRAMAGDRTIRCLATVDRRAAEAGMIAAAADLGVPILGFTAVELAEVVVPNPGVRAAEAIGTPSVAEAAALLACARWCDRPRLLSRKTVIDSIAVAIAGCPSVSRNDLRAHPDRGRGHDPCGSGDR